ncbi:hypothetical protein FOI68_03440 [Brevibacillus sp. LEMMJ03]|uniref:hypothetical protein n=1 Tax=unclassified Brevibacillus TaxID=2684853 RepID=UPI0007ECB30C|nr:MULTISPECIES: hypothetical protein [unclassified Brevibacillus]TRY27425.1 hypothetical protein FOI68_03440 [Brevibacillus sp. LEMMJ03]UYZ12654.1 hypothetical protein A6764_17865 [Brevibacillus sp. WF146]
MEQNISFTVSWSDATRLAKMLQARNLRYAVKQLPGKTTLAFVFPKLSLSQYVYLYILFGAKRQEG